VTELLGGRKSIFILAAMAIIAAHELLRISDADVQMIVYLALGGAGVVALEKSVSSLRGGGKPTTKK
jgi:predicted aconitase